ncbi:hypothetical protein OS187_07525 [Xanthomonadaceae bacterium JHOS43]|nr:hypothetical protein [Xanthomonadaceae bacterium JHOS43]MCX7562843.1 hypothetical protein [Xanthomonadaceae bacterium XH05]
MFNVEYRIGRCALVALCLVWLAGIAACARTPPEQRLRERIAEMQVALEERRPSDFIAGVADDFSGESGLDREGAHNLMRAQVLRNARIGVTLGPLDIELHGERATVKFSAVLAGGSGGLVPDSARPWAVTTGWRDGSDGWQLIHASWEPML